MQVASCVLVAVVMAAAVGAVPFGFQTGVSVHHSADRTGLAAGVPLVGFHDAGAATPEGVVAPALTRLGGFYSGEAVSISSRRYCNAFNDWIRYMISSRDKSMASLRKVPPLRTASGESSKPFWYDSSRVAHA